MRIYLRLAETVTLKWSSSGLDCWVGGVDKGGGERYLRFCLGHLDRQWYHHGIRKFWRRTKFRRKVLSFVLSSL